MDTLLVIGATSKVGTTLVPAALKTRSVRVATRTPDGPTARQLAEAGAEVVAMDLRDRRSIDAACVGVGQVVLSAHAFGGKGDNNTQTVDRDGQQSCIEAAKAAGLQRVVLVSVVGASPDAPMALFRAKWQTEQALAASGMQWTSVRATAFMETWASLLGTPVLAGKRAGFRTG